MGKKVPTLEYNESYTRIELSFPLGRFSCPLGRLYCPLGRFSCPLGHFFATFLVAPREAEKCELFSEGPTRFRARRGETVVTLGGYKGEPFCSSGAARLQGGFDPSKIPRPGVKFGLLVRSLPGPNKQRARKPSMI